jgi:hypothetical protein
VEEDGHISSFGVMNRKIRGTKEFICLANAKGDDSNKRKKLETLHQAEFLFIQAVRTNAGEFNKQHGTMELMAARGMLALERQDNIYDIAFQAYPDNPVWHEKVKDILEWWRDCAKHLYEMGLLMKSQEKMTPEQLLLLKKHLVFFVTKCNKTGMGGRASTEGFENKHHFMALLKVAMKPVMKTDVRVAKLSQ